VDVVAGENSGSSGDDGLVFGAVVDVEMIDPEVDA